MGCKVKNMAGGVHGHHRSILVGGIQDGNTQIKGFCLIVGVIGVGCIRIDIPGIVV